MNVSVSKQTSCLNSPSPKGLEATSDHDCVRFTRSSQQETDETSTEAERTGKIFIYLIKLT